MILSDNETKVDLLNNEAIAKTIVSLIKDSTEQPISIGIHGDWGAGKSSILEMVENEVKLASSVSGKKYSCIRFNGWKHQGFEDSKVALMSSIISELEKKEKLGVKNCDRYSTAYVIIFNNGYFKINRNYRRGNCWSN